MKYKVLVGLNIGEDDTRYEIGEEVELTDLEAAGFMEIDAVEPIGSQQARPVLRPITEAVSAEEDDEDA